MSLTTRIAALVALALLPALAIQGYNEVALRTARAEAVRADALRAANAAAADLGQVGQGARQVLGVLGEAPQVRDRDAPACAGYLTSVLRKVPGAIVFGAAEADGRIVCDTLGSAPGSDSVADRRDFQEAMRGGFAVGDYVPGPVTGRPTIQFAQGVAGADGRPSGVVFASIDLEWLAARLAQSGLPEDATLTVADRNGIVLLRLPDHVAWVGRPLPAAFWHDLSAHRGGVVEGPGLTGKPRVTGVAAPSANGLDSVTVAVGLSRNAAFADIDAAARRGAGLIVAAALLALAAAVIGGRVLIRAPVLRLQAAAASWRRGDLGARARVGGATEFGQLGQAFDDMAAALQSHEGELRAEISRSHRLQEQQTLMLHELNHRVRNTLATVQSLTRQSRRSDDRGERLEERIISLSKTHDLLSRDDWAGASLQAILENELAPFQDGPGRFRLRGPDLELTPRYVLALGMTLHELTTNAAKYGALSTEAGRVEVAWSVTAREDGVRHLRLEWRESGGPAVATPDRQGFGTRLITGGISRELDGRVRLDFAAAGLRCTIDVPLDEPDRFTTFRPAAEAPQPRPSRGSGPRGPGPM